ncbi:hypothetical protein [Okeania sp.]|uniref:hypothetical protein n=1 Tax=Okeania sp. TaxID=3100323 RepID=UPI002B4B5950|nr:hypothetical protein [Okeania sp.]MEB3339303.1 hypothetical protein [Okeania sp.]
MENREISSKVSNNPQNQLNWLEIVEHSALWASAFGSFFGWFFQEILLAVAPITLALFLNRINRKIFEEKVNKQTNNENNEIVELKTDMNLAFKQLELLGKTILEKAPESSLNSPLNQSNFEYNTITKEDWEAINIKFSDIEEEIQSLKDLATYLQNSIEFDLESTNNTSQEELQAQITKLKELNQDIIKPYLVHLIRAVKKLQNTRKS